MSFGWAWCEPLVQLNLLGQRLLLTNGRVLTVLFFGLLAASCKLRATSYELQATSFMCMHMSQMLFGLFFRAACGEPAAFGAL